MIRFVVTKNEKCLVFLYVDTRTNLIINRANDRKVAWKPAVPKLISSDQTPRFSKMQLPESQSGSRNIAQMQDTSRVQSKNSYEHQDSVHIAP